jgi:Uma2 family endonuclease
MVKQHLFTANDLMTMSEAGMFTDKKAQLLDGVIYDMSPASPLHEDDITEIADAMTFTFRGRAKVREEKAIDIDDPYWLPHPDIALVKNKRYGQNPPRVEDIYLIIEVANTSLDSDLGKKLEKYASVRIQDYWVADLSSETWFIHRNPVGNRYTSIRKLPFGSSLAPLAFPDDASVWL